MYLTFEEYLTYGGTLDQPTFESLSFKCGKLVDLLTANRVKKMKEVPEAVKRCIFDLLTNEEIFLKNSDSLKSTASDGKLVASFSIDGYQETYGGGNDTAGGYLRKLREDTDILQKDTIRNYLAYERDDTGTLLLYRGVY